MIEQANREFGQMVDLMGQTRTGKQAQIDDTFEQLAARGTTNLHGTWKQGQDRVLGQLQGPKGAALADTINATTGEMGGKLIDGFDSLMDGSLLGKMEKVGQDIKEGLTKGVDAAKTAVGHAGDYVLGFKSGIGANSPATQFIPLGQNAAEGFLIGFESQMIAAGAPMSLFNNKGGARPTGDAQAKRRAENEALLKHPAIQAMMDAIGVGEGTFNPKTGQRNWMKWFGNAKFTPTAEHPGLSPVPFFNKKIGKWDRSSAAGGGQFLERTWDGIEQDIGNLDFNNLHHQELAFVEKMRDRGMTGPLLRGVVRTAMALARPEWASVPGSPYKQPTVSQSTVVDSFNARLANSTPITDSNPMPVAIVKAMGDAQQLTELAKTNPQALAALNNALQMTEQLTAGKAAQTDARKLPTIADAMKQAQELAELAKTNPQALKALDQGLKLAEESLSKATPAIQKLGATAELTAEQIEANRKASDLAGGAATKPRRDPIFDKIFTREGVAGDFHGGLQGFLSGLEREKPTSLAKQFGIGLIKDIQGRLAHDFSAMITGSLFGDRDGGNGKLGGGLLQSIFGSLFGGGKASGGPVSASQFYVVGERGPELFAPGAGGHIYNHRETKEMMGGSGEQRITFALGDRAVAEAIELHRTTGRSRRSRIIEGQVGQETTEVVFKALSPTVDIPPDAFLRTFALVPTVSLTAGRFCLLSDVLSIERGCVASTGVLSIRGEREAQKTN